MTNTGNGDDTLCGGDGIDVQYGIDGNDYFVETSPFATRPYLGGQIYGGSGDDTINGSVSGATVIDGGDGFDTFEMTNFNFSDVNIVKKRLKNLPIFVVIW